MSDKIYNPETNRFVSSLSPKGKELLKKSIEKEVKMIKEGIKVKTPEKLKKGSEESIQVSMDIASDLCKDLHKKGAKLGAGANGIVYCLNVDNCKYVIKIQAIPRDFETVLMNLAKK